MVVIEGKAWKLENLLLSKFMDSGAYKSANLNVYLNSKKDAEGQSRQQILAFQKKMQPLLYSATSNYLLELVYMSATEESQATRYIHKPVNLREVINLKAAADASSRPVSLSDSKINFGEITALARFVAAQVHNEGINSGTGDLDDD